MADKPQSYIKSKDKPNANVGFRTSNFVRTQSFKPGGMKAGSANLSTGRQGFSPGSFKTQHKG